MGAWKLTVRDGSDVSHAQFEDLDEAVAEMRERAMRIRAKGPTKAVSAIRDFGPEAQVRGRLELSGGGLLRKRVAGVDVRGDGTFMPYRGRIAREELDPSGHDSPFDLVRETLE